MTTTGASDQPKAAATTANSDNWVEAYGDYLFNFAIGQVRDRNVAEDLVQETFLAAIRSLDRFGGRCSERTWLTGILRHKIIDHLRKWGRERAVRSEDNALRPDEEAWDQSVLWVHEVAGSCMLPDRRLDLNEFRANLDLALGSLPGRIAQVFQLYEIEERSNREVCETLNISESNLWVMLHRARKQLRAKLTTWSNVPAVDEDQASMRE